MVKLLQQEVADTKTDKSKQEEAAKTLKEELVQVCSEKEDADKKVGQLQEETAGKQEDIQAKMRLITKVWGGCEGVRGVCVAVVNNQ